MDTLATLWNRLSFRERVILTGGTILAATLITYIVWIEPIQQRMKLLDRLIPRKEQERVAFARDQAPYLAMRRDVEALERRFTAQGGSFSSLEEQAERHHLRSHIVSIRPLAPQTHPPYREIAAEVKLERVRPDALIPFLGAVEKLPYRIRQLVMKTRFSDPSVLDIQFVIASYEKISHASP